MKTLKKIVSLLMVASMVLAMLTVAVSAAPATGTKYSVDLSINKNESDRFVFKAIDKATGAIKTLEDTPRASWSADWPALWVADPTEGHEGYTVYTSESDKEKYDLMAGDKYKAVLAFKAPADGYYDVYFKGNKYQSNNDSFIDVSLVTENNAQLLAYKFNVCGAGGGGVVEFDTKGVKLSEGEEVWVVVDLGSANARNGGANFVVLGFDVTYLGTTDPGTFVEPAVPVGMTYKLDLNMTSITSSRYYALALKKSDNSIANLEQTAEATWSADYPGFYVEGFGPGGSNYVIYKNEPGTAIFDQSCGGEYKSVLSFKVPADGFYDIYYSAKKYQNVEESVTDIMLIKKGADEPLASKTAMKAVNDVLFDVKNAEFKKGDEIWVVYTQNEANTVAGNSNLGVFAFDVTYIGTESAAEDVPEAGDVYNLNLSMTKPSSKRFYFSAIKKEDGTVGTVEPTARASWSPDYPAFYVQGTSDYVIYTTEKPDKGYLFDQICGGAYKSVIAFKAPADGLYNVYYKAVKYQNVADSITDISLVRTSSAKVLASKTAMSGVAEVEFDVKKVYLSKGEELQVIYTQNEANLEPGNSNLGVLAFDVTYVGEGERTLSVGDKLTYDLAIDQKENGYFKLAGILADGTIDPLQDQVGISWGDWKGWKLSDGSKALFCETQVSATRGTAGTHGLSGASAYIDMQPRPDGIGSPAIIFTAPKTGTYKFSGLFSKLKMWPADAEVGNVYKIEAIVGGEVVATYTFAKNSPEAKHENALLEGHVVLQEGETIMFVASHVSGGTSDPEIAVRNIEVVITSFGTTIPNPGTSDNLAVAVVLLVLASLGIVVVSKKRR